MSILLVREDGAIAESSTSVIEERHIQHFGRRSRACPIGGGFKEDEVRGLVGAAVGAEA